MRRVLFLAAAAVVVTACAKPDAGASDSSAAAAAAPAMLTASQLAGTWTGMSMAEGTDSVVARWTAIGTETSAEVKVVLEGSTDTVVYTRTIDADSSVAISAPFTPATPAGGPQVINRSVARLQDGKLVGTYVTTMASKPDSVVGRGRFEATKNP